MPTPARARAPAVPLPEDLRRALAARPRARAAFQALPPSHRREYALWVDEAKRPATRARRIEGTVAAVLAHGKG